MRPALGSLWPLPLALPRRRNPTLAGLGPEGGGLCVKPAPQVGLWRGHWDWPGRWFLFCCYLDTHWLVLVPVRWRQEARSLPEDLEWEECRH